VPAGAPVLAIARAGPLRARVYAPQAALGALAPGDEVALYVDGFPERAVPARVERIWDEAEFTASNVQTPEDRMLLLFRVDLEVEPRDDPPLRPGTNVVVELGGAPRG
jgi:HlyD family secretion protein